MALGQRSWGVHLGHITLRECFFYRTPARLFGRLTTLRLLPTAVALLLAGLAFNEA